MLIIGAGISGHRGGVPHPREEPAAVATRSWSGARASAAPGTCSAIPGIRSDSDIFTLSFPYEPWTRPENVADGDDIREYLTDDRAQARHRRAHPVRHPRAVRGLGFVDRHLDGAHRASTAEPKPYRGRFLFFGTGYYNYDEPYRPEFPGIEDFAGDVVHPQFWPESLDYTGKRVVGDRQRRDGDQPDPDAGARRPRHVTMLQRSPTYMMSMPRINPMLTVIRKVLPLTLAHAVARFRNGKIVTVLDLLRCPQGAEGSADG